MKVIIPNELVNGMAYEDIIKNHEKKAKREIEKERINDLVSQGIERTIAKSMVKAYILCDL